MDTVHDVIGGNQNVKLLEGKDLQEEKYEEHKNLGDGCRGVNGSRSDSFSEAKCDQHMETFVKCIKASGR